MRVEQENRKLTPQAFHRLLDWVDQDKDSEARSYLEMRRRLVNYFDRKNVPTPDDLAEETLNLVELRIGEEGIADREALARDCYTVARIVLMNYLRLNPRSETLQMDRKSTAGESELVDTDEKERMLNYVEECMNTLDRTSREIVTLYYAGKEKEKTENRRVLAERLGVTQNALSMRAYRIREKLEWCVKDSLAKR